MLGTVSDVVSVVSLLISAAAFGFAVYTWRRQFAIEKDRRAEELASRIKADVVASFERRTSSAGKLNPILVLWNRGQAIASEVMVEFPTMEGDRSPLLDNPFPVSIGSDQRTKLPVAFVHGDPTVLPVRVTWTDETGHHDETFDVSR